MKRLVLIFLLILHISTATIDVEKIKEIKSTAAQKLHTLKEKAAESLQQLTETASSSLKDLKERASYGLQHFTDDIDLNNLHKLDVLQIGPALKTKYELIKDLYNKPETKVNVVHIYGDDLKTHFDHAKFVKVKEWHPALPHHHHLPIVHDHEPLLHHHHHPHHHHHHHLEHYHVLPYPLIRSDD